MTDDRSPFPNPLRTGALPLGTPDWYERIGFVAPYDTDYWWEIDDAVTAVEAGAEIAALLRLYCLPTLERLASTAKLRACWLGGGCDGITDVLRSRSIAALDRAIQ